MNFEWTQEQQQLRDSVARVLADNYSFEKRRAIAASEAGSSPAVWRELAQLGVTTLPSPEADGGCGGGAIDLAPVMQEFGRALLLEPFFASVVLGATAVRLAADEATQRDLLPQVASGEAILAFAHDETGAGHAPLWVETRARPTAAGWRLDGAKINVLQAPAAGQLVVTARLAGAPDDPDGLVLFLVDADAEGLQCRGHRLIDDSVAGELRFASTPALPLGDPKDGARALAAIQGTIDLGMAALCSDALGAMESAYELTIAYLNTRKQFGRLIGEYQSMRHRAAEMLVGLEVCRSMAIAAALAVDDPDPEQGSRADLLRAKIVISRQGRNVCQQAIQLHGGIGMTEEYAVGHSLRRLVVIDQLFGDGAAQAARLAALA
jgi:pimeloyl-CoA dehydrogenase